MKIKIPLEYMTFMADELDTQVNVRMPKRLLSALREIEATHGISPADALRRLAEEMATFYKEKGWFTFPIKIEPRIQMHVASIPLDVWNLDPELFYQLEGFELVNDLMRQLKISVPLTQELIPGEPHSITAFHDHPTHWIVLHQWKDLPTKNRYSLFFEAYPKTTVSKTRMLKKLKSFLSDISPNLKPTFYQLPFQGNPKQK